MRWFKLVKDSGVAAPAFCCLIAASMWSNHADAQGFLKRRPNSASARTATKPAEPVEKKIRLAYISTSWEKVLQDVADKTGSNLVMYDTPPGSFSRNDLRSYPQDEAIQILNNELENRGYRILMKDQNMTVISTRRDRMEYERPVVGETAAAQQASAPQQGLQPVTDLVSESSPPTRTIPTQVTRQRLTAENIPTTSNNRVQPAAHETETSAPAEAITQAYTVKERPAVEIAKQIHQSFQSRSKLEMQGPHGLPGFSVKDFQRDEQQPGTLFILEIDADNKQLLVTAEPQVQAGLKTLINRIDVSPLSGEGIPSLMAGHGKSTAIAERLKAPISMIAQSRSRANGNPAVANQLAQADPQAPPQQPVDPPLGTDAARVIGRGGGLMTLSGNLKGDVTIETIPGFDLLIIRGNEGDIETVMRVIQEIEDAAVGSLPEIHLLMLQHVDSRSLAQLLNDVYEQLAELRSESAQQSAASVNVVPVVVPNAVLILAPKNTMPAILDLAAELDQEINPTFEIEVVRLEYAVAASVVEILQGFYPEDSQEGLGTRLRVAADPRTNSVVVQAEPRDLSEVLEFIKKLDADEAASISQMRVVKLKNASAEELATFLTSAFASVTDPQASTVSQTINRQQQNQTEPKSVVLEFIQQDGAKLARSGLLDNIVFNAEPRTNTLQFSASPQSIPLIEELIKILDQPSSAVVEVKYIKLFKADATAAVELLTELFAEDTTNTNQNTGLGTLGVQLVNAADTASSLVPLRFVADVRTNSVIATGGADALIIVEALLAQLDATDPQNRKSEVIKLLNIPADQAGLAINEYLTAVRDLATIDPDRISTSQLLEQEIIVTPEINTNSLIISATPAYFTEIERLIKTLDKEFAQVQISGLIVEVTLDNTDEFGVELGFQDPVLFGRGTLETDPAPVTITRTIFDMVTGLPVSEVTEIVSSSSIPGFNFNNQPLGNNAAATSQPSHLGTQGLSNFALQRQNNDLGYGGLVLSASSNSVSVLIRALASRRQVRVLSRPLITTLDNYPATITLGQEVPVAVGVIQTNTSTSPDIERQPAGIILEVQPRINPDGQIVMNVTAEKSTFTDEGTVVFTDVATGSVVTAPIKNVSTAITSVKVPDGQTVVLGGMITDAETTIERKVPWLGDLPILGNVFRFDSHSQERTELIMFLTPRIVHNESESEEFKSIEWQRLHAFQEVAEEVHGPLFGIPPTIIDATSEAQKQKLELELMNQGLAPIPPLESPSPIPAPPTPAVPE